MANITTNIDIDYIAKDFSSLVDAMISFANVNYGPGTSANRLWSDFNADSFSRNWLEIVAFVADIFFFYFDNQATQSYLQTATLQSAISHIAAQFGFTPASATSASGVATFTVTGAGTIPRGFVVTASNGEDFYVTSDTVVLGAGTVNAGVLQGDIITQQFTAQGLQNEEFDLQGPNVVVDLTNLNSSDISPQLSVNGNGYTLVSSFINSNGTDSVAIEDSLGNVVGGGGRVFTLGQRSDGTPFVTFGDGTFGRKLNSGEVVTIVYRTGGGTAGNIPVQSLNTVTSTSSIVSSVTNNTAFSGGTDVQSIAQLRDLIPASLRTLQRAVAVQDYSDILVANFDQVLLSSAEANTSTAGVDLNIYVVPQGNTITKISDNPVLKNTLVNFIDRRKTVTVQFQILDAYGVDVIVSLNIYVSSTTSRSSVAQSAATAIQNFLNLTTGGEQGTGVTFAQEVLLKDINNLIEAIPGVERFEIRALSYRPVMDYNIVGLLTTYTNSEISIFPSVEEAEWLIVVIGPQSNSAATLFENTSLVGFTYTSGTGVIQYASFVNLANVAPGDVFYDGAGTGFTINGVDTLNYNITLSTGLTVNSSVTTSDNGSIKRGNIIFENTSLINYTYTSATGIIQYASAVNLSNVIPGYFFYDGSGNSFVIISVSNVNHTVTIAINQTVNTTVTTPDSGSIKAPTTTYQGFKCYKNILASTTNLSINSITDTNLNLTLVSGTGVAVNSSLLLDNANVYLPGQYATGSFYLIDASGNVWEIVANSSDTVTVSGNAVNDPSVTAVTSGVYKIVQKMSGRQVLFNNNIFNVQYNTDNTLYSTGAEFSQIGTIGDKFSISQAQSGIGDLGLAVTISGWNSGSKLISFSDSPDLSGINSSFNLIDANGQIFNIVKIDNYGKTLTTNSNLTPAVSAGATISRRYYDDNSEVSFLLGNSSGVMTYAADANALGKGTVSGNPNRPVDSFVFRTSPYADDIVNLRANEIPQYNANEVKINVQGGVD